MKNKENSKNDDVDLKLKSFLVDFKTAESTSMTGHIIESRSRSNNFEGFWPNR